MTQAFDPTRPTADEALKAPSSKELISEVSLDDQRLGRAVFSPLRPDLIFQRQDFKNEEYYVIKDPLSLSYFRLQAEETFLISLLDGRRSLGEIVQIFNREFPNTPRSLKDVASFLNQLGQAGLLSISAQSFLQVSRAKPKQMNFLFMIWVKVISKILFFKVPLHDPSAWLGDFVKKMSFLWSKPFVYACIGFFVFTLIRLFGFHWEELSGNIPRFFVPSNIVLIWLTMIVIKTFHEFGHAMTCRYFGGEVHEMGVCVICLFVCGYVDASDAWMMRHQRHKIYTTIAGVFVEFIIASILANIWLTLPQGLIRDLAFNGMIVASINTVMFNMNPLMKFDGYYVISDVLQIPNLRTKAITYCSCYLQRTLLGYRNTLQESAVAHEEHGKIFLIYAMASYVYMAGIIYSLSQIFARFLEPYGLKSFGLIIGVAAQGTFLMMPIFRMFYDAFRPGAHIVSIEPIWKRLSKWGAGALVLLVLFFGLPTHYYVKGTGIVMPADWVQVASPVGGILEEVYVHTGQEVDANELLGTLRNREVLAELKQKKAETKLADILIGARHQYNEMTFVEELPHALSAQESAYALYTKAKRDVAGLQLTAPEKGAILTPDVHRLVGRYFKPEEVIFQMGDLNRQVLMIPLSEDQVELVTLGSVVTGHWMGSGHSFHAEVVRIVPMKLSEEEHFPAVLEKFGGPLTDLSQVDPNQAPTQSSIFFVEARFVGSQEQFFAQQMRAKLSIKGLRTTFAQKAWRSFVNFWNLKGPARNPFSQGKLSAN